MKSPRYWALQPFNFKNAINIMNVVEMKSPRYWALQLFEFFDCFKLFLCRNEKPEVV